MNDPMVIDKILWKHGSSWPVTAHGSGGGAKAQGGCTCGGGD